MKSKKVIMGLAAVLILFFHLYIPITHFGVLAKAAYIGVDLFFLVSALSLNFVNKNKKINYAKFIKNRILHVYIPFVIFTIIGSIYLNYSLKRFFLIISGIEFLQKGGSSFLWYFPGIMILYFISPLLIYVKNKYKIKAFCFMILTWGLTVSLLQYLFNYTKLFILLNRLPLFFIGLYWDDFSIESKNEKLYEIFNILLMILGSVLIYNLGTTLKLNSPVKDFYYIIAIPFSVSLVALIEIIYKHYSFPVLSFIGKITLELYSLQMIFGYKIENSLLKKNLNGTLAFIITISILIISSYLANTILNMPYKLINKQKEKTK